MEYGSCSAEAEAKARRSGVDVADGRIDAEVAFVGDAFTTTAIGVAARAGGVG